MLNRKNIDQKQLSLASQDLNKHEKNVSITPLSTNTQSSKSILTLILHQMFNFEIEMIRVQSEVLTVIEHTKSGPLSSPLCFRTGL